MLLEPPQFLDREDQLELLQAHIGALRRDPAHFKVVEVLGLGGMGKTSLLEQVWNGAVSTDAPDHLVWVSLEGEAATSSIGPLLAMRDQLDCQCLLFDTAVLAYWNAMGQPLQLTRAGRLADSLAVKALELGGGFAGFALPIGFGIKIYDHLKRVTKKRLSYQPEEFQEVEQLHKRPGELLRRLPYYLGIDVKRSVEAGGQRFIAFYDAYDRQTVSTREAGAPWMQEFVGTLGRGLHVVSTREPLRWVERRWRDVVVEIRLDALPEDDARAMLDGRISGLDRQMEDRLIRAARRIPFLLETVINGYAELARLGGDIALESLPSSPDSAVAHFLEHFPEAQRELAIALAATQVFDEHLFRSVVADLNVQVSFQSFHKFTDWYFVESISAGLYKTHDLLSAFVRESSTAEGIRREALNAATRHLLRSCHGDIALNPDKVLPIMRAVIAGWYSVENMPTPSVELLVDVGFRLYDAGYWNELASLGSEASLVKEHPADVLLEFFLTLTARRILGVEPALERFEALLPRAHLLGRHADAIELEASYVQGLAGEYAKARSGFKRIVSRSHHFDPGDRTHVRARMYHGGMLLMDGAFRQSSSLLAETYDAVHPDQNPDWGELVRYRGHAYRFSVALDEAESLYLRAMRSASEDQSPALLGRLHTNLAETYCWSEPHRAVVAAEDAAKIHASLGNRIELAKCDAALGVALSKLGDVEGARVAVAKAVRRATDVGYQAGVAFALQAGVVTEWFANDHEAAAAACRELTALVDRMGTYRHLQAIPFLLLGDDAGLAAVVAETEWLTDRPVSTSIARYLAS
jgi:tetratricopeptide (TPR) repeat protein